VLRVPPLSPSVCNYYFHDWSAERIMALLNAWFSSSSCYSLLIDLATKNYNLAGNKLLDFGNMFQVAEKISFLC
jgi:hypothetical protein